MLYLPIIYDYYEMNMSAAVMYVCRYLDYWRSGFPSDVLFICRGHVATVLVPFCLCLQNLSII